MVGITYIVVIFFILSPENIQIIPKHIGYNYYYDHTITRTTPAQNPTIGLSVMQIKGSHLGFYIDFMVIFFKLVAEMNSSLQNTLE